jgi:hypothetical protein
MVVANLIILCTYTQNVTNLLTHRAAAPTEPDVPLTEA